jgi:hypothetical protein
LSLLQLTPLLELIPGGLAAYKPQELATLLNALSRLGLSDQGPLIERVLEASEKKLEV